MIRKPAVLITTFSLFLLFGAVADTFAQRFEEPKYFVKHKEKQMGQASPDKALIYVMRPKSFGKFVEMWTFADHHFLGITRGSSYIYALVDPGEHVFWSKSDNLRAIRMTVEAGKTYYLGQKAGYGGLRVRVKELTVLDESKAQSLLNKCRYYITFTHKGAALAQRMSKKFFPKAQNKAKPYP